LKDFFGNDFLICNKTGLDLFSKYAKDLPIYDYHCHLSPEEIASDKVFFDIGELLLKCDHYKWRLMRACGVSEELVTGNATFKDKFYAFANIMPSIIGSPVYQWTHLELKNYFGINYPLNAESAAGIYEKANALMADGSFSAKRLIEKSNVALIATTDDPSDDLKWHKDIRKDKSFKTKVVPTFRPDLACNPLKTGFSDYIKKLGATEGVEIKSLNHLIFTMKKRLDLFESVGSKIADHGIENIPNFECTFDEAATIFENALTSKVSDSEAQKYLFYMLTFFAGEYKKREWVMQIHMSVIRNQNSKLFDQIGPDCGVDSPGDILSAKSLGRIFDYIETTTGLPKTILYSLNPTSNYVLSTMLGNFAGETPGKMQFGAAWWFCDHRDGIIEQLKLLASTGAFGQFVGMLTDSRSFISYARHEYFRRILCSLVGEWVESGEIPNEPFALKKLVQDICFNNANDYFKML